MSITIPDRIGGATGAAFVALILVGNQMASGGPAESAHPTGEEVLRDVAHQASSATLTAGFVLEGRAVRRCGCGDRGDSTPDRPASCGLGAQGMSNTQIARKLVVSPKTVRNHVSNIFTRLQVNDRAEAIKRAQVAGLGGLTG